MAEADQNSEFPQIYLITPAQFDPREFGPLLAGVLDAAEISCLRLRLTTTDEDDIAQAADICRDVAHQRDVAIVIDRHVLLADRLGLDGVHLTDGARSIRKIREEAGPDAIIGADCGTSRHEGMNAGEAGADYISFGPISAGNLGDGSIAEEELFTWWSEMIEIPVVAEGGLTDDLITRYRDKVDFFALGDEIWSASDPAAEMARIAALIRG